MQGEDAACCEPEPPLKADGSLWNRISLEEIMIASIAEANQLDKLIASPDGTQPGETIPRNKFKRRFITN